MRLAIGYPMQSRAEVEEGRKRANRVTLGAKAIFVLAIILGTTWLTR